MAPTADHGRRIEANGQARAARKSSRCAAGARPVGEVLARGRGRPRDGPRRRADVVSATIGRRRAVGDGERLELLDPAERCCPAQPGEAGAGVGHHPQRVADPERRRRVARRLSAGGGELARERPAARNIAALETRASAKKTIAPAAMCDLRGAARPRS